MTAFSSILVLAAFAIENLFPSRFWALNEFVIAIGICWISDSLSIVWVDTARRRSGSGVASVWIGTLPRLGGPILAIVILNLAGGPKSNESLTACLVFVYLVSLPVAVWLTLPEVNRKIEEPENIACQSDLEADLENNSIHNS